LEKVPNGKEFPRNSPEISRMMIVHLAGALPVPPAVAEVVWETRSEQTGMKNPRGRVQIFSLSSKSWWVMPNGLLKWFPL
jgi:hypothetical protein